MKTPRSVENQLGPAPKPKPEPWEEVGYSKESVSIYELLNGEEYNLLRREDGVKYLLDVLDSLKIQVEENPDEYYDDPIGLLARACGGYWTSVIEREEYKESVLLVGENEKRKLELLKKKLKEKSRRSRRRVPDFSSIGLMLAREKLELVQRYTAAHEKRRYRALAQLERLQRQRSGEVIPPDRCAGNERQWRFCETKPISTAFSRPTFRQAFSQRMEYELQQPIHMDKCIFKCIPRRYTSQGRGILDLES